MRFQRVRRFYDEAGAAPYASFPNDFSGFYEQMQPARAGSVHADVLVPLFQAVITGVFVAAAATVASWYLATRNITINLYIFAGSFILVAAFVWVKLLADHNRLLWHVERLTGRDFDGDGYIGEPPEREPDQVVVVVRRPQKEGENVEFLHYGVHRAALEKFARAALRGESLAVNRWTGSGAPFSRGEYENLRAALKSDGLLRTEKGKMVLTPRGEEIFGEMTS